jgi:predicted XRE-type DNA-binding protein/ribosomal protein S27AE
MPKRKTFAGSEQDAEEFIRACAQAHDGQRMTILALQAQVALAIRIGMPRVLGITDEIFAKRCYEADGGTIRLSIEKRREAAAQLTAPVETGGEGLTQREAAAVLGVTQPTVSSDLRPDKDLSDSKEKADKDLSELASSRCAQCGTSTLPNWVNEEDEFTGRLLCGRCAEASAGIRVIATGATGRPEEEAVVFQGPTIDGREVWQAFIDLSALRDLAVEDLVQALPTDRLEYALPVIEALGEWLPQIAEGVRQRVEQLPASLAETRYQRDRKEGRLWHAPA